MTSSPFNGEIRYPTAQADADQPMDTALWRDAILGTALHKADEAAQVRASWVAPVAAITVDATPYAVPVGDLASGALRQASTGAGNSRWYQFGPRAVYIPKIRADGSGYDLRVRIAGASSDGGRVDFGVVLLPKGARWIMEWGSNPAVPTKLYSNITSTTAAWLTPDDASHIMTVDARAIADAHSRQGEWSTLTDISGDRVGVRAPLMLAVPIAQTHTGTAVPHLYGFHASEWIGGV